MTKDTKFSYLIFFICAVILAPIIFFPISGDLSIYALAGKTIAEGKNLYVDYIDIKPPLFYLVYAGIYKVMGVSELALRIFDFIYQLIFISILFKLLIRITNDKAITAVAVIAFSLSYTTLNYTNTLHAESFIGLPLIIIFLILSGTRKSITKYIILGILVGFVTGIKYPFVMIAFLIPIFEYRWYNENFKKYWYGMLIYSVTIFITFGATFFPIYSTDILNSYKNVMSYLTFYASQPPVNFTFLKESLKAVALFWSDLYSLSFTFLFIAGILFTLKKINGKYKSKESDFIDLLFISITLLVLSLIIEHKINNYYPLRLFVPLSVLIGYGTVNTYKFIKENFGKINLFARIFVVSLFMLMIVFSPVIRWFNLTKPVYYYYTEKKSYDNFFDYPYISSLMRTNNKQVAEYIKKTVNPHSFVMVIAVGCSQVNYFLKDYRISRFAHSLFYLGNFQNAAWQENFRYELHSADAIVIQSDDRHPSLTGHSMSSFELINNRKDDMEYLYGHFTLEKEIETFKIYKRNKTKH